MVFSNLKLKMKNVGHGGQNDLIVEFGGSATPQEKPDKALVGGKGRGLQEMSRFADVPPGFTLTTEVCQMYDESGQLPDEMWNDIKKAVERIENDMGKKFGDATNPLIFSCRSGAAISMPGMMDTILNCGLNHETVTGLAKATESKRFAYDAYRRLLDLYGDVVLGIPHNDFEKRMKQLKSETGKEKDTDLTAEDLEKLCKMYKDVYDEHSKKFPEDPYEQLKTCIKAVFESWNSERAVKYREINGITGLKGTACSIQTMVFGNLGDKSGTGVAFSRDPGTGEPKVKGEYLINAQGEDVVAGIRTPEPISKMQEELPEAYSQFCRNIQLLEQHFKDMQDVEFTVENGKLWMLQTRSGKRTGQAAFRIAHDMVNDEICTTTEALLTIEPEHVKQVLHPTFSKEVLESSDYKDNIIATGLNAGPGAAVGKIVFTSDEAEEQGKEANVILVRGDTSPDDVGGMWASKGVVTERGGLSSHAAVFARGWGLPCVCGCDELEVDEEKKTMKVKKSGEKFKEGDVISINGNTGEVIRIELETSEPQLEGVFGTVMGWADEIEDKCKVMANADSGADAEKAVELGASGIGLCRTEHMFLAQDRLPAVRRWVLKGEGIDDLRNFQRKDFQAIFEAMNGNPVTIRLLDPPLHEFLPKIDDVDKKLVSELGYDDKVTLVRDIENLNEQNPMLGLRGCRLGITRPELTTMQTEAIMNAAADITETDNKVAKPLPRIMVPLIATVAEFESQAKAIKEAAEKVKSDRGVEVLYEIGTMIEVPRAALISKDIASVPDPDNKDKPLCQFFSFGTNDLTQMAMGISRDDAGSFIHKYQEMGILEDDPFQTIDVKGVGHFVRHSCVEGREGNPKLSLSVCGEHGGDAKSIEFFDKVGLDYVSCSPFRVPVARLASAQAAIKRGGAECDVRRL